MQSKRFYLYLSQRYMVIGLWTLSIVGVALSLFISFQAGCAGDVKTMASGDVKRALQLEGYGLITGLASVGLSALAFCLTSKSARRVEMAVALAFFLLVSLWIVGFQIEGQGIQSCIS